MLDYIIRILCVFVNGSICFLFAFGSGHTTLMDHKRILSAMGLPEASLIMHIGGGYRETAKAKARFLHHFRLLPHSIARRLALENDHRSYTADEVLAICQELGCPMVLDGVHGEC